METLRRVLERDYTELFIQLGVDALIRASGWLKHLSSPDPQLRKKAASFCETLRVVIGDDRIDEFCKIWPRWREGDRESKALQYYVEGLCSYFPHVECVGIPIDSKRPAYYLIYTTRKDVGRKIMGKIILTAKRKGTASLEGWL